MKKIRIALLSFLLIVVCVSNAQETDLQIRQTAIEYARKNDFSNALMVLSSGLTKTPNSLILLKELAFTYYLAGAFEQAAVVMLPLVQRDDADIQTFQIAGNIFNGLEDWKQSEKIYRKGLKKFPQSGQLYSEYGQLLWSLKKTSEAITEWEHGITEDPTHSGNYYHAAKFYFAAADKARCIVYGETFVNLESFSARTDEMKYLLIESYKRIFNLNDSKVYYIKKTTDFEVRFLQTISRYSYLAAKGIGVESLYEMRLGFINEWFKSNQESFPFSMFDRFKYMVDNGMFEAYNRWLFGMAVDVEAHQTWVRQHQQAYDEFLKFQRNNLFHPKMGQHYF